MRTNASTDLENSVNDMMNNIDFGDLESAVVFGGESFTSKLGRILAGEFAGDFPNMISAIFSLVGGAVMNVLPMIVLIVAISILSGFIQSLRAESSGDGVRDIIHFVTYSAVVIIVMYAVADVTVMTGRTLTALKTQMDILFPILLTLMAGTGGAASVGVYQPSVVLLSNGVMQIFTFVAMPLFIITLMFSIVGNLSNTTRYDKFVSFFTSAYKWILGITFTVFIGFLTIQGITAGTHDGVSIRAARFTISSYVPFLGGYLSQGMDLILASSILIKNAIGLAGMYLLFGIVLSPILHIAALSLGLKLAAAITQPLGDQRISNFLTSVNKCFSMLVAIIIGAAFMYFLTIGLIIMTGNFI